MKDLYTFDATREDALKTYEEVRMVYDAIFRALKLPFLVAEASSGSIGGTLSHEYHVLSPVGEDTLLACNSCSHVANEEVSVSRLNWIPRSQPEEPRNSSHILPPPALRQQLITWTADLGGDTGLIQVITPVAVASNGNKNPRSPRPNWHGVTKLSDNLTGYTHRFLKDEEYLIDRTSQLEQEGHDSGTIHRILLGKQVRKRIFDRRVPQNIIEKCSRYHDATCESVGAKPNPIEVIIGDVIKAQDGDGCPKCRSGVLKSTKAVELGHTFFLGTKYSEPLEARISPPPRTGRNDGGAPKETKSTTAIEMGCHGIGVSRMVAAVADILADEKGLNWPRAMAPFEAVVIPTLGLEEEAVTVFDILAARTQRSSFPSEDEAIDVLLDDRKMEMSWKLKDADLIGYPVIVILGKVWKEGKCEVQCHRLRIKENVLLDDLRGHVEALLAQL
jgi:prolyl-tRNA synthetase